MLFQNILVPVDLSSQSTRAFKVALDVAKKYDSKITIITCLDVYAWHSLYYELKSNSQLIQKQKKIVMKYFKKLESIVKKNNISVKFKILTSESIVNDIVTFAKSQKHDLVIIGSHGRTGFNKWILGSISNGVTHRAKCPVLIVR